ncbi:MAG: SEC-C metal-binding domain-containing protein [Blastocatellia bacterium]
MILSLVVPMSVPLFQSWYPDKPSFEMLDDKMQAGYKLNSSAKVEDGACIWLEAWNYILYFCACDRQKTGRNDSCPCGSGKKFKKCCGG